jgi:hypothetical protein
VPTRREKEMVTVRKRRRRIESEARPLRIWWNQSG